MSNLVWPTFDEPRAFGSDASPNPPRSRFSSSCLPRLLRSQIRRTGRLQSRLLQLTVRRLLLPPPFRWAPLRPPAYPLQPCPRPPTPRRKPLRWRLLQCPPVPRRLLPRRHPEWQSNY